MVIEKIMAIIFSLLILGQAVLVRRLVGTWIFPACLFGLFWFLYTFIPLVSLLTVPVDPYGVAYILLCCLIFSATALGFNWRDAFARNRNRTERSNYGSPFIRLTFYGMTAVVVVTLLINILLQGFSLSALISNPLETANLYIARRYSDDLVSNVFSQISVVLTYPAAILGGLVYANRPPGNKGVVTILLTMLPSVLVMLIQGAKGTLFLVISMFWAGILICKTSRGEKDLFSKGALKKLALYFVILLPVVVASFMARGLYEADDTGVIVNGLIRYFASYSCAHLYAFSDWFAYQVLGTSSMSYASDEGAGGFYTFMALFMLFGSSKVAPPGVYDDYFEFGEILMTNIYTMFRGLIQDFGMAGSLVFMVMLGLLLHTAFWYQLTSKRSPFSASTFVHSVGFFYMSFGVSLLMYNSIYASFLLVALIFLINDSFSKSARLDDFTTV